MRCHSQCPVCDLDWESVSHAPVGIIGLGQIVGFETKDGIDSLLGGILLHSHALRPGDVACGCIGGNGKARLDWLLLRKFVTCLVIPVVEIVRFDPVRRVPQRQ